ncbi:hypothetical protein D3C81_1831760 [compost metagenome]
MLQGLLVIYPAHLGTAGVIDAQVGGDTVQKRPHITDLAVFAVQQADEGVLQKVASSFAAAHLAGEKGQQFVAVTLVEQRQAAGLLLVGHGWRVVSG